MKPEEILEKLGFEYEKNTKKFTLLMIRMGLTVDTIGGMWYSQLLMNTDPKYLLRIVPDYSSSKIKNGWLFIISHIDINGDTQLDNVEEFATLDDLFRTNNFKLLLGTELRKLQLEDLKNFD